MKIYAKLNNGKVKRCNPFIDLGNSVIASFKNGNDYQIDKNNLIFLKYEIN